VAHKLMFTAPARARCFASSVVTLRGCEGGGHPLPSSARILPYVAEKKERSRNRGELLSLQGAASPSLLNHGRVGLDHVGGHTAPAKSCESGLRIPEDPTSPVQARDMSWHVRRSMSFDLFF
jgi:hypothetical protein